MRCISLVLILLVVTMASASDTAERRRYDVAEADKLFEEFVTANKRQYKDDADKKVHFDAFKANLETINKLNEANPSATYGINKFADYTEEERKTMRGLGGRKQT